MYYVAKFAPENAVELVLTLYGVARITAFTETVKFAPIVPAPWFLTYVAADSPLVAKLRARYL
jgi:hypothetical protein